MGRKGWGKLVSNVRREAKKIAADVERVAAPAIEEVVNVLEPAVKKVEQAILPPSLANAVKGQFKDPKELATFQLEKRINGQVKEFGKVTNSGLIDELAERIKEAVDKEISSEVVGDIDLQGLLELKSADRLSDIYDLLVDRINNKMSLYDEEYIKLLAIDFVSRAQDEIADIEAQQNSGTEFQSTDYFDDSKSDLPPYTEAKDSSPEIVELSNRDYMKIAKKLLKDPADAKSFLINCEQTLDLEKLKTALQARLNIGKCNDQDFNSVDAAIELFGMEQLCSSDEGSVTSVGEVDTLV